jgi:predicted nucleic acid-binding protein
MSGAALPAVAGDMLESLHAHRLLTARQLRTLHAPAAGSRWTEKVMALLLAAGLVDFVRRGGGARRIYFLTADGHQALQLAHPHTAGSRRGVDDARHAASALSAHTLAVNDVGLTFVQAARERGDEFGPLAWRHEIAHPIGATAGRRTELVISDAVLNYLQHLQDGGLAFHYRFLELDRATEPTAALAAKLSRYARLFTYTTKNDKEPQWHQSYPVFPEVLVVLTNGPDAALRRRAQTVLALCQADALLQATPQVAISIATLDDLLTQGPWATTFQRPHLERPVTWTGEPA